MDYYKGWSREVLNYQKKYKDFTEYPLYFFKKYIRIKLVTLKKIWSLQKSYLLRRFKNKWVEK